MSNKHNLFSLSDALFDQIHMYIDIIVDIRAANLRKKVFIIFF